ncbi:uncharacterized protein Z519_09871 [Cladophialophora bantiana CBS 173.52]|uniref:Zn(2)-C6 fungal-type domain-containing protein n=1 Tax=Cladophialophora bantiana (strain ATCC 10958 / CBS 173.52 / CDC B-1940 / NIH 8579) TaxID=1442370 RepID=A0A0D2HFZ3_CLAB1|nr:uncharacterized protein Z519_09871 [Cladophialophora bantiana CBS 173.52]KIW89715.1 hypothetical protein Z519_09871 [Cladophialophora bantiana CBS 173.52]
MPAVSRLGRKKRWHHKDFNGCIKCKQRRVKCGSEKPACVRCQKLGVVCPGYQPRKARLFEFRPKYSFQYDEDRANYDYFLTTGSKVVALSQATSEPFWTRLVPQLAENNAVIRHGLIALGALLRPLHAKSSSRRREFLCIPQAAAKHSASAMHQLRSAAPGSLSPEMSIACSLVLAELDKWMEKETSPVLQIMSAHRFLKHKSMATVPVLNTTKDGFHQLFEPMVDELLVDACSSLDNFPTLASGLMSNYQLANGLDRINSITTYMDALHGIASLLKAVFRSTCPYIVATAVEMDNISFTMDTVGHKLQHLDCRSDLPVEHRLLQVHHRVARIVFYTLGRNDEWIYDLFHRDFCFIVKQTVLLMTSLRSTPPMIMGQTTFTPTLGLIPPLFLVATKCRDSHIRGQALQMLHSVLRNERGWTSCMAATISRFVIQKELQSCVTPQTVETLRGKSIILQRPEQRIKLDEVEFSNHDNKIYLAYTVCSKAPNGSVGRKCIASIPYLSHPSVEKNSTTTCQLSRKVLRHCGYTGIILFSPQIDCHCIQCDVYSAAE